VIVVCAQKFDISKVIHNVTESAYATDQSAIQIAKYSGRIDPRRDLYLQALIEESRHTASEAEQEMDSEISVDLSAIQKLSDKDKAELSSFIQNESQRAKIQACTLCNYSQKP
jgi:hypothetical protein